MLTGDKGKTAKMIGVQCGMFSVTIKDDDLQTAIEKANEEEEFTR
jgi:magnesium-transporting ATPase (P-type)